MNPPVSQSGQSSGQTIVIGGGSTGGSVPFHTHPATALSTPVGDDQLPERLDAATEFTYNCDSQIDNGWWNTGLETANSPDTASFFVGQTISQGFVVGFGYFGVQLAYETAGDFRAFLRTINAGNWSAWEQIDRDFYDTRYQLVSDLHSAQAVQSANITPNGTANSTLTGLSLSVTSPGTSAVYMVSISADVQFNGAQVNIIELLVDGVAESAQLLSAGSAAAQRHRPMNTWRITGLAAGSRTFTARTRNSAAGTNAVVNQTHTLMTVTRVS